MKARRSAALITGGQGGHVYANTRAGRLEDAEIRRKIPRTSRLYARKVRCPNCGAAVGDNCFVAATGAAGRLRRQSCHLERHTAAIAMGAPVLYD